jgi:hypothetical protein
MRKVVYVNHDPILFHFGLENAMQALHGRPFRVAFILALPAWAANLYCCLYNASAEALRIDIKLICWMPKGKHYSLHFVPCGDQMNPLPYSKH